MDAITQKKWGATHGKDSVYPLREDVLGWAVRRLQETKMQGLREAFHTQRPRSTRWPVKVPELPAGQGLSENRRSR